MTTSILKIAGAGLGVLALAACASTQPQIETAQTNDTTRTASRASGPVAGSQEDLEQTAGHRVFFGYDQYTLTPQAQATLDRQAAWLKEYPGTRIRLAGNCDERGTREYNLALGARRANAAKDYLVSRGVDSTRIQTISYGKERPIDTRSTADAWALNRNATTQLVGSGA